MPRRSVRFIVLCFFLIAGIAAAVAATATAGRSSGPVLDASARWKQHDHLRPRPAAVEPAAAASAPTPAPGDAIVLFDGTNLNAWKNAEGKPAEWLVKDGVLEVVPGAGGIETRATFGDVQLHVEWAAPDPPRGVGQDRGNSGIFLMGEFELQVLDSHKADTYADGLVGAIYGQYPPLSNAARPPGQWQSYDIAFRRPRFDAAGALAAPARFTVFLNGILVQNNEEPWGQTSWLEPTPYDPSLVRGPIRLQDHSHPVRFRNIWIRNLPDRPGPTEKDLNSPPVVSLTPEALDAFAGQYAAGPEPTALRASISREAGHLMMKLPFRPTPLRLDPISDTVFVLPRTDAEVTFRKDNQGRVVSGVFRVGDADRALIKETAATSP